MSFDALAGGWAKALGFDRKQFKMFFEKMMDGFAYHKIVVDKAGKPVDYIFLEVNSTFEKMTGLKKEKIIGKKVTEVLKGIENDPADWIGRYGRVALTGEPVHFEDHAVSLGKWFNVTAYSPEKGYFVALFEDITERKKAQDEIGRLASFPQLNPNSVVEADLNGNVQYENFATEKTFADLKEKGHLHPFFSGWDNIVKTLLQEDNKGFGREHLISDHWYYQFFSLALQNQRVRIYSTNIDELKMAEEALRESERRWATTLSSIGDAVIATDVAGNITFLNPVAEALTGWTSNEAAQKPIKTIFNIINEQTRQDVESPVTRVLKGGTVCGLANHTILIKKDGNEVPIDDSGAPIRDKDGNVTGVVLVFRDITERKKAEEKIAQQAFMIANANDAIIGYDSEQKVTFWNKSAEQLYGYEAQEAIGKTSVDLLKPEYTNITREELVNKLSCVGHVETESVRQAKNGRSVSVEAHVILLRNEAGKSIGYVSVDRDITERKQAEEALRKSEEQYRSLFTNMMDGFAFCKMIYDGKDNPIDFVYLQVNDAFEKITGLKREIVVGRKVTEAIPGTEKANPELFEIYGRVASTCKEEKFEIYFKPLSLWLSVSVYCPQKGYFAAIFEDISESKKSEEALRESEVKYRTVANFTYDWEYWIAPDGNLVYVSPSCERITGYKANEFIKDPKLLTRVVYTEDKAIVGSHFDLVNSKELHDVDFRIVTRDGEKRWISHACQAVFDDDGKWLGRRASNRDVTERKLAEQELWKAKNDWERTFDTVPDFIAILDNKHRILRANRAMVRQLGVSPKQAIGENCYKCVHGTNLPPEFCPHTKTLQDGKEHVAEVHEPRLGGDFMVSTTPLKDERGRLVGSVHVARNITERKKAEDILRQLNRHLRAVSNSNQALMHALDEAKYTQEVCEIIVHDCGYALAWVGFAEHDKAKTVRPVAYAGHDKGYIDQLKITWDAHSPRGRGPTGTVIRTGEPYICKNMQNDPNFTPWHEQAIKRHYTASCVLPLAWHDGKIFGALNIYSQESNPFTEEEVKLLTELSNDFAYGIEMLRLRQERKRAEATMHKQAALIDLSPDAIIVRKLEGKITFWSRGAERLYGYSKKDAVGQSIHNILHTIFPETLNEIMTELKDKGHWSGELVHQAKDGKKITVQSYWQPTLDEKGEITELMESNVDVTDRKQMQVKLEEYAANLEELVQERTQQLKDAERLTAIGETAGMVGHDLRNPLQTVTGETYLAKGELSELPDSEAKANLQESINTISEQIGYMDKIVSDLQDFVRPIKPDRKQVNMSKLLSATITDVKIPKNIDVKTRISQNLPEISVDAQLLKRVFINLVTNAVQSMPHGGSLTISTQREKAAHGEGKILIHIRDTGEGISDDVKAKVFKPLFTTKSKGQGFGLAVCKRVVEAHGGTITFKSQAGKGSTFTVELPA